MKFARKRILITGGSGLLGHTIATQAVRNYDVYASFCKHRPQLTDCNVLQFDLCDSNQVLLTLREIKPDVVIHTAALRSIDYCEKNKQEAELINVTGAKNIALACAEYSSKLIHISSDSVFEGTRGMYKETDAPNPVTFYGTTKLESEKKVLEQKSDCTIVRVNSIYGWSLFGQSIGEWILAELRQGKSIKMYQDTYFTPILANNLAMALLEIAERDLSGVYHISGNQRCTRYELAHEIAVVFELDASLVVPVNQAEVGLAVSRGRDSSLCIDKVKKVLNTPLFNLADGVRMFKQVEGIKS